MKETTETSFISCWREEFKSFVWKRTLSRRESKRDKKGKGKSKFKRWKRPARKIREPHLEIKRMERPPQEINHLKARNIKPSVSSNLSKAIGLKNRNDRSPLLVVRNPLSTRSLEVARVLSPQISITRKALSIKVRSNCTKTLLLMNLREKMKMLSKCLQNRPQWWEESPLARVVNS